LKRWFTWPRALLAALLLLALADFAIPKFTEGRFRGRLQTALEQDLGRKVEIGQVNFRLFPTPGFAIGDVTIGEDPAIGKEPAAYVKTLVARPGLLALLQGKFVVGSVRLEDASLNLTRVDNGASGVRWNFASLGAKGAAFPAIHMPGGRINFKLGDTKSIFYLLDTDVDLTPAAIPDGGLKIEVNGQPARTDRPARQSRGFGSFVAKGRWNEQDHSLELDVKLEQSELSDMLSLFEGQDSSLLGNVWGDAHLAGPMTKIGVTGHLNVSDLHGWNHPPPGGRAFPFNIGGTLDAAGQVLELQASAASKPSPISARLRVADYLGRPRWAANVSLDGIPVAPLTGMARSFGIMLPPDLALDGLATGTVGYSTPGTSSAAGSPGLEGQVRVLNATLSTKGTPPLRIAQADVRFAGSSIALSPAYILNDAGESAGVDGSYDTATGEMHASVSSDGMAIASLRRQISEVGVPIIGLATAGVWSGSLHYSSLPAGWTGDIHLKDTDISYEAFAQPLHLIEADASIDASGVALKKLRLTLGGISAQGEYRYDSGATRPHRFKIVVPTVDASDLESLLAPTLQRASVLSYAFNFGRVPEPDWLRDMHADGAIQAGSFNVEGTLLSNLRANVIWDGADVRLTGVTARVQEGTLSGTLAILLSGRQPRYQMTGSVSGFSWRGGAVEVTGDARTSGMGIDLLANLHAEGRVRGRKLEITPADPWDNVDGHFVLDWAKKNPKVRLSPLTLQSGGAKWTGEAETLTSGQMVFRLTEGPRRMEASGALWRGEPLKVSHGEPVKLAQ
jgi:hypothetical protein